jgi:hypothetical protein
MISLLKFFIPNIIKNTLFFYALALTASALLMISPMHSDYSKTLAGFIIMLVFPLYTYFNANNYLSASLGWILQTPVPKLSIILANGILNLFKIVFSSLLLLISWLIVILFENGTFELPDSISFSRIGIQLGSPHDFSIQDSYFFIFLVSGAAALLFGILPDMLGKAQLQRAQAQQLNLKSFISKGALKQVAIATALMSFVIFAENNEIPNFITYNLVLGLGVLASIYLTLNSVKYVYDIKKPIAAAFLIFFVGSYASVKIGNQQISNHKIALDERFDLINFLGSFQDNGYETLFKELKAGTESSIDIGRNDLLNAVQLNKNKEIVNETLAQLNDRCNTQTDHTCRLASYITNIRLGVKSSLTDLDFLRKGCPKDLLSCSLLGLHAAGTQEDHAAAHSVMMIECKNRKDNFNQRVCTNYYNSRSKQIAKI